MPFIANTPAQCRQMLAAIGVESVDDLFADIPPELRCGPLHIPPGLSEQETRTKLAALAERVRAGATVAIACRAGLDRAGMTAACLLREAGLDADGAIDRVHAARAHTLTMPDQLRYVRGWPHA